MVILSPKFGIKAFVIPFRKFRGLDPGTDETKDFLLFPSSHVGESKVQKKAYKNLLNAIHPNTLHTTLVTRISDLIDPYVVDSSELHRNIDEAIVFKYNS